MFIVFRCSAGGNHGWGNVKRLELIYNALKKKFKFNYKFLIDSNLEVKKYLRKKKISYISVTKKNEDKVLSKIKVIDISIIELLNCSLLIQKKYKKISKKLIILDDITKRKYISDILISCQKKINKIHKIKECKLYNDYSYFPLTQNFDKYIIKKKIINKEIKSIVILIGGSNYINIYICLAKILCRTNYKITFLIGEENSIKISKEIKKFSREFIVKIDSNEIPKNIFGADLVIAGGGYTKLEAAYLKTPMLCIRVHKHQEKLIQDFFKTFNLNNKLKIKLNKTNLFNAIKYLNYRQRHKISNIFLKKFKKNGVYKIIKIINEEK